jgi:thiol-disulfide isomerase/thioredoxin
MRRLAAVASLLAAGCGGKAFKPLAAGDAVPRLEVRTLAGDTVQLGRTSGPVLVNIWATWCVPCREEFPELESLHRDFRGRGLTVLAVSVDQGGDGDVRDFIASQGSTFAVGRDPDGEIQRLFQTVGVPESFLIDARGILRWRKIGALRAGAADARTAIDKVLE